MSQLLTHVKPDNDGWVITMTPEMARAAGVAEDSLIVFYLSDGAVAAEILPPASPELRAEVHRIADKFRDAFTEMKRLGD
ncbi:MAG: hypothetical protein H0V27_06505 [Pyrinomonadaceae bacterium]|nr:hypothetical protein [Pyrinomonadaceae bacterium]